jgi:2-(1,2-epoxy-1,2-dihydrophenyl)acetyl-CoA isomerase
MMKPIEGQRGDRMSDPVRLAVADGIATITLNRPDVGNALDTTALQRLMMVAIEVDDDPTIKCVILTGEGRLFCAGGDVVSFGKAGDELPSLMKEITVYLNAAISHLSRMEKPLICAINGAAAGAGLGLALIGDLVIAADTAVFTTAYAKIGLSPDGGVSWILPRLVGLRTAQELAISSRKVSAQEALSLGMVTRVVTAASLQDEALAAAIAIRDSSPPAIAALRALFLASYSTSLETHLELEARSISALSNTAEAKLLAARFGAARAKT